MTVPFFGVSRTWHEPQPILPALPSSGVPLSASGAGAPPSSPGRPGGLKVTS